MTCLVLTQLFGVSQFVRIALIPWCLDPLQGRLLCLFAIWSLATCFSTCLSPTLARRAASAYSETSSDLVSDAGAWFVRLDLVLLLALKTASFSPCR